MVPTCAECHRPVKKKPSALRARQRLNKDHRVFCNRDCYHLFYHHQRTGRPFAEGPVPPAHRQPLPDLPTFEEMRQILALFIAWMVGGV